MLLSSGTWWSPRTLLSLILALGTSCLVESNSFGAFMALAGHHSCSGHRGLQQGWEAGALPHSKAGYKVPPTFVPNTPPSSSSTPDTGSR